MPPHASPLEGTRSCHISPYRVSLTGFKDIYLPVPLLSVPNVTTHTSRTSVCISTPYYPLYGTTYLTIKQYYYYVLFNETY